MAACVSFSASGSSRSIKAGAMEYETVQIEKTANVCPMCESYANSQASKPIVVMSCEGGCLRGEVARRAVNLLTFELAPEKTALLGGAEGYRATRTGTKREAGRSH